MRKILILFMALILAAPMMVVSQNVISVHLKEGNPLYFAFKFKPVISFTDSDIVLTTSEGVSLTYPLAGVVKFTFENMDNIPTETDKIADEIKKVTISIDEYFVTLTGAQSETSVRILSSDGKQINTYKTDKEGSVSFSISELPQGAYVISSEDMTVKILKQ